MKVKLVQDVITEEERIELRDYVLNNLDQFHTGIDKLHFRVTTRLSNRLNGDKIVYPPAVYTVQERLRSLIPPNHKIEHLHGKDGLVVCITYDGGDTYLHRDPRSDPVLETLRCNICVSAPEEGAVVYVEDKPFQLREREMMQYMVTKHRHQVTKTIGDKPRILYQFGFLVKAEEWESTD
jgi:hypothetical protein